MRPTKLLTISALTGLSLISYGKSAQAVPVNVTGTVLSSCSVTATPGALTEDGTPATNLVANSTDRGTVVVTCNDTSKSLQLKINSGSSVIYNGIAKIRANGDGGVFGTTNTPGQPTANAILLTLATPTAVGGDKVRVQARIDAPIQKLLTAGNYTLVVDATITP